ncbi:hypothetical protein ACLOJK_030780 [Asimina triloba]
MNKKRKAYINSIFSLHWINIPPTRREFASDRAAYKRAVARRRSQSSGSRPSKLPRHSIGESVFWTDRENAGMSEGWWTVSSSWLRFLARMSPCCEMASRSKIMAVGFIDAAGPFSPFTASFPPPVNFSSSGFHPQPSPKQTHRGSRSWEVRRAKDREYRVLDCASELLLYCTQQRRDISTQPLRDKQRLGYSYNKSSHLIELLSNLAVIVF